MSQSQPAAVARERGDDFTQIHGVTQTIVRRLNQAGIHTFAQLANMSTEAPLFSHMPSWSIEQKKNLISEARHLMGQEATIDKPTSASNPLYSAQFSVDLLLDDQKRVLRTHILHVESREKGKIKEEDSWAGWNMDNLTKFLLRYANIESAKMRAEIPEQTPIPKRPREVEEPAKTKELVADLNISEVEIQARSGKLKHRLIAGNEPFVIKLTLDMNRVSISPNTPLQYQTEVYVKDLSDGHRRNIGENSGTITSKNLLPLAVNCDGLPQGSYRLEAWVTISPDIGDSNPRFRLMAMTEGKVFRVS